MSVQITYKKEYNQIKTHIIWFLFVDEKFNISNLKKYISTKDYNVISDLIKNRDTKKKIVSFDISSKKKLY